MSMDIDFGEVHPEFDKELSSMDKNNGHKAYQGPERRLGSRRRADDRRNTLRFEPGKCIDRREHCDRRIMMHNYHPTVN